jgi:hypothetical protein
VATFEAASLAAVHEVQLARPNVSVPCPIDPRIPPVRQVRTESYVMRDDVLVKHVIVVHQEIPGFAHFHCSPVSGWERTKLWHPFQIT